MARVPVPYRTRQHMMQTTLRLGGAVARHNPWLRRMALRAGDRMVMACALGGDVPLFEAESGEADLPVTVLVRGGPQVERYALYESDRPGDTDRASFHAIDVPAAPLYGGGIHVFRTDNRRHDRAYFVRAYAGDRSHDSDIMAAPIRSRPTRHVPGGLTIAGEPTDPAPAFDWAGIADPHWVSFLVLRRGAQVRDSGDGLLVAVYAWGDSWRYPNLAAAPFHYTSAAPPPEALPAGAEALYFAVRRDGWISAFAAQETIRETSD